jgi:S-adenosylmethionine/arginine decarboxylase-like enzyme
VEADLKRLGRERFEDEGGATAVLVLSTSHIAIHGWPHRDKSRDDGGFFWLSVCSCREFDPDIVDDIIYKSLGTTKINRSFNHILS